MNSNQKQCSAMSLGFTFLIFFSFSFFFLPLPPPSPSPLTSMPKIRNKIQICMRLFESFCVEFSSRNILQMVFPGKGLIRGAFGIGTNWKEKIQDREKEDASCTLPANLTPPVRVSGGGMDGGICPELGHKARPSCPYAQALDMELKFGKSLSLQLR